MNYIVFDLEFNQDLPSLQENKHLNWKNEILAVNPETRSGFPYEIIQIGAVKLDEKLKTTGTFNRYVKPVIYKEVSSFVTELTGITTEQLNDGVPFTLAYLSFLEFIGGTDAILCVWGMSDLNVLYKNAGYHRLDTGLIPKQYLNIQSYVPAYLNLSDKKLIGLQTTAELLEIPLSVDFHDAGNDAIYTAQIFRKIYSPSLIPDVYEYTDVSPVKRSHKKTINYDKLLKQFEKMYGRPMTKEETEIIELAYKMGRTGQFTE
ncbi:exonuclease domain-containing protein [Anaerocolumna sp. AGMB13025]|uniref:3'-5' exonuclease n=1 Tax=Anaerocolumna sp. AGMB13025 TaxID=3039116 RepID=UPI00241FF568|nr:3'-5' exonuclease [Anaerocolumna sp. AGMB13025]WFR57415.1 exonuclease domain-containing protein [Anaerocolumna sp. AGMB13025]